MINNSMALNFRGSVSGLKTTKETDQSAIANMKIVALGAMQNKSDCFVFENDGKHQVTLTPKILREDNVVNALKNIILKAVFNSPDMKPVAPVSLSVKGDEIKATIMSGAGDSFTYTIKDQNGAKELKSMIMASERKM